MEVTINYNGQAVAVEVTLEVYEFLDRADHNKSSREAQIVGEKTTGETFRTSASFAVVSALGVRAFFSY